MTRVLNTGIAGPSNNRLQRQSFLKGITCALHTPKYEVAVVIPLYKPDCNHLEEVSLDRCFRVLARHPIVIIKPTGLDVSFLREKGFEFQTVSFPEEYFISVDSYSRLLLSRFFYESFLEYKYILIYQTDAFVFRDDLLRWCAAGFDYIGAPWLGVPPVNLDGCKFAALRTLLGLVPRMVGNGGISLRKISKFTAVLCLLSRYADEWKLNEDGFWAHFVPSIWPFFTIPDVSLALNFAFELEPRAAFMANHEELPFGCHAWGKYDIDFWRPIFKEHGYQI